MLTTHTGAMALLYAFALTACSAGHPLARSARGWNILAQENKTAARTAIAAAVPVPTEEAAPATPPPASSGGAARGTAPHDGHASIRLYTEDGADCPTVALGIVREHATDGDAKAAVERMKANAARLGADAIVGYTVGGDASAVDLAGVAVRCGDLKAERPYDTLGTLDVPAAPGDEQAAFEQMLDQANRMHANLVVDVHLAENEDGGGRRVVGAAIRYR